MAVAELIKAIALICQVFPIGTGHDASMGFGSIARITVQEVAKEQKQCQKELAKCIIKNRLVEGGILACIVERK